MSIRRQQRKVWERSRGTAGTRNWVAGLGRLLAVVLAALTALGALAPGRAMAYDEDAPPFNDDFANAAVLSGAMAGNSGSFRYTNVNATTEPWENPWVELWDRSVWFSWTPNANGPTWFAARPTRCVYTGAPEHEEWWENPPVVMRVYTGDPVNGLSLVADQGGKTFAAVAGTTYHILVADSPCQRGAFFYLVWNGPSNDETNELIQGEVGRTDGTTLGATCHPHDTYFHDAYDDFFTCDPDVGYRWQAPKSAPTVISLLSDKATSLRMGFPLPDSPYDSWGDILGNTATFNAEAGKWYSITVSADWDKAGPFTLQWAQDPPEYDMFDAPQVIAGVAGKTTPQNNVRATGEYDEPYLGVKGQLANRADNSLWFEWKPEVGGPTTFRTINANFNTLLAVYSVKSLGTCCGGIDPVASNDDFGGKQTSQVSFNAVAGQDYRIAVDGYGTATGTFQLAWTPANDDFSQAMVLKPSTGQVSGTTVGATVEPAEWAPNNLSVWYTLTPLESGPATVTTWGSSIDTTLTVYVGETLGNLVAVASNDNAPGSAQSKVNFDAVAGQPYRIAVRGVNGAEGAFALQWSAHRPANDDFVKASTLSGVAGSVSGSSLGATGEPAEPNHAGSLPVASVWYSWTAPETGPAVLTTAGSSFDTVLAVYQGSLGGQLAKVASNDDDGAVSTSRVEFGVTKGVDYRIAVSGKNEAAGAFKLDFGMKYVVNIDNASVMEGNAGPTFLNFTVTLTHPNRSPVSVEYVTADGTAYAGEDYRAGSGTVTFASGEVSKVVTVEVRGDTKKEGEETFLVKLSHPTNTFLGRATAIGTIASDD